MSLYNDVATQNSNLCAKQPTIEDRLIPLTCCLVSIEYIFSCVSEEQEEKCPGMKTVLQQTATATMSHKVTG